MWHQQWHKSSYPQNGGTCVEARWATSSYSGGVHQNCVEVAEGSHKVLVRDTQYRHLGHLTLPAGEWQAFLHALRRDELG